MCGVMFVYKRLHIAFMQFSWLGSLRCKFGNGIRLDGKVSSLIREREREINKSALVNYSSPQFNSLKINGILTVDFPKI